MVPQLERDLSLAAHALAGTFPPQKFPLIPV